MGTYYGVHRTLEKAGTMLDPGEWGARVKCSYDSYEAKAVTAGSTISMCFVPKGARIIRGEVWFDDLGTTGGTLKVGDGTDDDEYMTSTAVGVAAGSATFNVLDNLGEPLDADEYMIVTTGTKAMTGTIKMFVWYVQD